MRVRAAGRPEPLRSWAPVLRRGVLRRGRIAGMADTAVRPRRVLRTVLVVLLVGGLGVTAVGAITWCSVFGCSLFPEEFEPQGEEATQARAAATATTADLLDRATAGRTVLAGARGDGCTTGQHNWKRKDTYSHECRLLASRVVVVTTGTDLAAVAQGLTDVDGEVRALGCTASSARGGLDRVRDEYWTPQNRQVARYGAAGLPLAVYTCGPDTTLEVRPTGAQERSTDPDLALAPLFVDETLTSDWYGPQDVRALTASGAGLAVVLTVTHDYYRTRF